MHMIEDMPCNHLSQIDVKSSSSAAVSPASTSFSICRPTLVTFRLLPVIEHSQFDPRGR